MKVGGGGAKFEVFPSCLVGRRHVVVVFVGGSREDAAETGGIAQGLIPEYFRGVGCIIWSSSLACPWAHNVSCYLNYAVHMVSWLINRPFSSLIRFKLRSDRLVILSRVTLCKYFVPFNEPQDFLSSPKVKSQF